MRFFDAYHRFRLACVMAIVTFLLLHHHPLDTQLVSAWDVFALITVGFAWAVIITQDPYTVRRDASFQDASGPVLFGIVLTAACVSLFAVILILGSNKSPSSPGFVPHLVLAISAIGLSWSLVHTVFSLHYAHVYYLNAHKVDRDKVEGGLIFPGDEKPDYYDFAYFSFIIGMTCQVSDVQISSKKIRRMATIHGLISFAFNTAILAMFVNIVASVL